MGGVEFAGKRVEFVFAAGDEDEVVAVAGEFAREFGADAGGGAGDQHAAELALAHQRWFFAVPAFFFARGIAAQATHCGRLRVTARPSLTPGPSPFQKMEGRGVEINQ